MHIDAGILATYIGLFGTALMCVLGLVYKMGGLSKTLDGHVKKIGEWEQAMSNLNAIPDIKTGVQALADRQTKHEDISLFRYEKQQSQIAALKTDQASIRGKVDSLYDLRNNLER